MSSFFKYIRKSVLLAVFLILLCGFAYPLAITGISHVVFPDKATGSLVTIDGKAVGSSLVGQDFTDPMFMKCRPSAVNYNTYTSEQLEDGSYTGIASGSQNLAPTSEKLVERVETDMSEFLKANPNVKKEEIPTDLMTASGSGLDPHISPAAAIIQVPALEKETGLTETELKEIISENTKGKTLGIFGEETVNVLNVNLEIYKRSLDS